MPHTLRNKAILYKQGCRDNFSLGEAYRQGHIVAQDMELSLTFYRAAAKAGDARAYSKLGEFYELNDQLDDAVQMYIIGKAKGDHTSQTALTRLVSSNNPVVEYHMGLLQEKIGNLDAALPWYVRAVYHYSARALDRLNTLSEKQADAAFCFASLYETGKGLPQNHARAIELYQQAITLGHRQAHFKLGHLHETQGTCNKALDHYLNGALRVEAICHEALLRLASENNERAVYCLGVLYEQQGDEKKAILQYKKAFAQGSLDALNTLEVLATSKPDMAYYFAKLYEQGRGVKPDVRQAVKYYQQAISLGHLKSYIKLGKLYELLEDQNKALQTYFSGAVAGHRKSKASLKRLSADVGDGTYYLGRLKEQAGKSEQAMVLYKQALSQGSPLALDVLSRLAKSDKVLTLYLAQAHELGLGATRQLTVAFRFYCELVKQGDVRLLPTLQRLLKGLGLEEKRLYNELCISGVVSDVESISTFQSPSLLGVRLQAPKGQSIFHYGTQVTRGDAQHLGRFNGLRQYDAATLDRSLANLREGPPR